MQTYTSNSSNNLAQAILSHNTRIQGKSNSKRNDGQGTQAKQ